jgi:hypothetical protein
MLPIPPIVMLTHDGIRIAIGQGAANSPLYERRPLKPSRDRGVFQGAT